MNDALWFVFVFGANLLGFVLGFVAGRVVRGLGK